MTLLIRHELSIVGNWVVTSLKLADQMIKHGVRQFDNETVEKRFLELVWNSNFPKTIFSTRVSYSAFLDTGILYRNNLVNKYLNNRFG